MDCLLESSVLTIFIPASLSSEPGDEMTDSYFPDAIPPMTRAERREHLSRRHGFECACAELCDREAFEVEETDRRVVEATALFGSVLALARRLQTKGHLPDRSGFNAKFLDLASKLEDAVTAGKVRSHAGLLERGAQAKTFFLLYL